MACKFREFVCLDVTYVCVKVRNFSSLRGRHRGGGGGGGFPAVRRKRPGRGRQIITFFWQNLTSLWLAMRVFVVNGAQCPKFYFFNSFLELWVWELTKIMMYSSALSVVVRVCIFFYSWNTLLDRFYGLFPKYLFLLEIARVACTSGDLFQHNNVYTHFSSEANPKTTKRSNNINICMRCYAGNNSSKIAGRNGGTESFGHGV